MVWVNQAVRKRLKRTTKNRTSEGDARRRTSQAPATTSASGGATAHATNKPRRGERRAPATSSPRYVTPSTADSSGHFGFQKDASATSPIPAPIRSARRIPDERAARESSQRSTSAPAQKKHSPAGSARMSAIAACQVRAEPVSAAATTTGAETRLVRRKAKSAAHAAAKVPQTVTAIRALTNACRRSIGPPAWLPAGSKTRSARKAS